MNTSTPQKLIFVYNANSGTINAVLDSMHKVLSPSTYSCNLCDITFGLVGEKGTWRDFRESFPVEMEFLHKDEYEKGYSSKFGFKFDYPIVLCAVEEELQVLVNTSELNQLGSAEELIKLIEERVEIN